ncbi:helix-turn-helix domain-containing protein [Streptomyces sp. NPDC006739]|uniref:helix-turn-helix domain-containing protein n=1 Tax=Streptomyces sp. NPDC006739 TaxID=3364763 RepID=UPI0036A7FD66
MDTQHPSAPSRPQSGHTGKDHPHSGGLTHDNTRHTNRFTVIGNHLTQHAELTLLAIGLACHIQSLPKGARVDIKTLAVRFPEGATRIAAALRELEAHGYLRRVRERAPGGRIVTRTISCNQPGVRRSDHPPLRPPRPTPAKRHPAGKNALPAVPQPVCPAPALLHQAADLLAGLRRQDQRLLLSTCDIAHLAPGIAAWLERDVSPAVLRHALTADLPPDPLSRPAALLAHRLTARLPPPPPFRAPAPPPPVRHPFQTCDGCDRPFRSPAPGRCRDCRSDLPEAAGARLA